MIAVSVNPRVDFEVILTERDMVAVWVGKGTDRVLVVSVYNPFPNPDRSGPLASKRALQLLSGHRDWVIAGDFNAHHPDWSGRGLEVNANDTLCKLAVSLKGQLSN